MRVKLRARMFLGAMLLGISGAGLSLHILLAALGRAEGLLGAEGPFDLLGLAIIGWGGLEVLYLKRFVPVLWLIVFSIVSLTFIFRAEESWIKALCLVVFVVILVALLLRWNTITKPEADPDD